MSAERNEAGLLAAPHRGGLTLRDGVLVLAMITLAVALRCIHLTEQSVWYDEYISIRFTDAPTLMECLHQQLSLKWDWYMVPLYHILEYYTAHLSGGSVLAVRGLSVLFGAGSAALIYLTGRYLFGTWAGVVAAALFAMSPFHIFHDQGIRCYSLVVPLAMLSVYAFVRALSGDGRRWWVLHVAANVLLMWTHILATVMLAPMGLVMLLFHFRSWRRNILWGAVHAAFIACTMLWIVSQQSDAESAKASPPPIQELWNNLFHRDAVYLHWVLGSRPLSLTPAEVDPLVQEILVIQPRCENALTWTFVTACLFLSAASVVQKVKGAGRRPVPKSESANPESDAPPSVRCAPSSLEWTVFLLLLFTIPGAVLFTVASLARVELFQARYFIYGSPALYLMAGGAVSMLQIRRRRVPSLAPGPPIADGESSPSAFSLFLRVPAAAALIGLMGVQTVLGVQLPVRHGYLAAAKLLRAEKRPEEPLVAHSLYTQWLLAYNLGKPPIPTIETHGYEALCKTTDGLVSSGKPFWVVLTAVPPQCPSPPDMSGLAEHYSEYLTQHGAQFTMRRFLGMQNVHVFHIEMVTK